MSKGPFITQGRGRAGGSVCLEQNFEVVDAGEEEVCCCQRLNQCYKAVAYLRR